MRQGVQGQERLGTIQRVAGDKKVFLSRSGFRERWNEELGEMNNWKRGGRFIFPNSLMKWFIVWKQLVDYRGLEGIARKLSYLASFQNFQISLRYGIGFIIQYRKSPYPHTGKLKWARMELASRRGMRGSTGYSSTVIQKLDRRSISLL